LRNAGYHLFPIRITGEPDRPNADPTLIGIGFRSRYPVSKRSER